MTVNTIPGEPGICWCGGPHRPDQHREVFERFLSTSERVLVGYDMHALDAEIALMRASAALVAL